MIIKIQFCFHKLTFSLEWFERNAVPTHPGDPRGSKYGVVIQGDNLATETTLVIWQFVSKRGRS